MNIVTKFDFGENIFFMHNNQIANGNIILIYTITVISNENPITSVQYMVDTVDNISFNENIVFATTTDLINSLLPI